MIYFDLNYYAFFLHDLILGFGTFVKLTDTHILENDSLFSIGESFMLINIIPREQGDNFPRLKLKIFNQDNPGEIFFFHAQEFYLCNILIGRSKNCQVIVHDNMISKQHASIFFTSDRN